jgi:ATP-dependent DNA ligase
LRAIVAAAQMIRAKSFTIDGEAVVLGPDGLSWFDELRHREAAQSAMLYAFDLIEQDHLTRWILGYPARDGAMSLTAAQRRVLALLATAGRNGAMV